jgi:hypothetical protein
MIDLFIGAAIVMAVSAALFLLSVRFTKPLPRSVSLLVLLAGFAGLAAYLEFAWDAAAIVRVLPLSNVMIVGNLAPPITAVLAGVAYNALTGSWWRRGFVPGLSVALACYVAARPIVAAQPASASLWMNGVWRQTDQASCTPAAAATFLNEHGITATEAEMSELCRTTNQGTSTLGLYRGLVLKTRGTPWKVRPVTVRDPLSLREMAAMSPVIINTGLEFEAVATIDPRYMTDWGWAPGVRHTVVLISPIGERHIMVADPAVGRERWDNDALGVLYRGEGFQLVQE